MIRITRICTDIFKIREDPCHLRHPCSIYLFYIGFSLFAEIRVHSRFHVFDFSLLSDIYG